MGVKVVASWRKTHLNYLQRNQKMMKGVRKSLGVLGRLLGCLIEQLLAAVGPGSLLLRPILLTGLVVVY